MCNCGHNCGHCDKETLTDEEVAIKKEYDRINGIGSLDIGSRFLLLKQVIKLAKEKGYHTADFNKMPKNQLKAIFYKLNA